jgi:hypothetical protein
MSPTSRITLLGCAVALGVAWCLEGTAALGTLAGFAAGASTALAVARLQVRWASQRPAWIVHLILAGFLAKLLALLAATLLVRFVSAIGERLDWRAFLVSFAGAVLLILPASILELLRAARITQPATPGRTVGPSLRPGGLS